MTEKKKIYLSSPTMHGDEQRFVQEAFDTNWVAPLGPNVNEFEKEMTAYMNCGSAAALSAGTAAIHLAVKLLNVEENDVVFCTSMTFSATCNPVAYEKARLVFIDSEPDTWNMSPAALKAAYERYPHPKALIYVHLYGTPAKIDEITTICKEHNTPVIEDAAEALGSSYKGKRCGTFGKFGILSFNGNKIITTSGGGMLLSDDAAAVERAKFLATQARDPAPYYQHSTIGYNYRMSNIVAGIGRGQLLHLEEHMKIKQKIYQQYQEAFADIPEITMNPMNQDGEANNWLSCITLSEACKAGPYDIMDALREENIETRPIWKPMHLQPVYEGCDFFADPIGLENPTGSVAEDIFNRGVCLPSDIKNTEEDMEQIIGIIRNMM